MLIKIKKMESSKSSISQGINKHVIQREKTKCKSTPPTNIFTEESLIPSNLLNESGYDFYPSKFHHSNSKPHRMLKNSAPHTPSTKETPLNKTSTHLFFETEISSLIAQLETYDGSLSFQNALIPLTESDINALLIRLCPHLIHLMCSHYGNYFIQKLFQKLNYNQRILIFSLIQYYFLQICTDNIGTYSIQALIDVIKTQDEEKILENLLKQNLLLLFNNENAHHIIQKLLIDFPEHKREYLTVFILENIDKICTNEIGASCMVKFIIMNSNLNIRIQLVKAMEEKLYILLSNKNGCSVLILLMEKYGFAYSLFIINEIKKNILFFSTQNTLTLTIVEKSIELLFKFDNSEFNNLTSAIFKNDKVVKAMCQSDNGKKILFVILKRLNNEQKNSPRSKKIYNLLQSQLNYDLVRELL